MATSVLFKTTPTTIGSLVLDAAPTVTFKAEVDATEHPVERGVGITDHLRPKPETLTIEGTISNTPIPEADRQKLGNTMPRGGVGRAEQAFETLRRLKNSGETVTVVCVLGVFPDMAITSVDVPKTSKTGDAIDFTCSFKQIQVTELKVVKVTRTPRASGKKTLGHDTAKDTPEPTKRQSVLHKFAHGENDPTTGKPPAGGGLFGALGFGG